MIKSGELHKHLSISPYLLNIERFKIFILDAENSSLNGFGEAIFANQEYYKFKYFLSLLAPTIVDPPYT